MSVKDQRKDLLSRNCDTRIQAYKAVYLPLTLTCAQQLVTHAICKGWRGGGKGGYD